MASNTFCILLIEVSKCFESSIPIQRSLKALCFTATKHINRVFYEKRIIVDFIDIFDFLLFFKLCMFAIMPKMISKYHSDHLRVQVNHADVVSQEKGTIVHSAEEPTNFSD